MKDEAFAAVIADAKARYASDHPMQKKLVELEDAYAEGKKFQAGKKGKKESALARAFARAQVADLDKLKPKKKAEPVDRGGNPLKKKR